MESDTFHSCTFTIRISEVLGLEWENIDFTNRLLHVRQAYHEIEKKIGRLKTKSSYRTLPISEQQFKRAQRKSKTEYLSSSTYKKWKFYDKKRYSPFYETHSQSSVQAKMPYKPDILS